MKVLKNLQNVNVWQKPLQYCKVISLQLIKINKKKTCKEIGRSMDQNEGCRADPNTHGELVCHKGIMSNWWGMRKYIYCIKTTRLLYILRGEILNPYFIL